MSGIQVFSQLSPWVISLVEGQPVLPGMSSHTFGVTHEYAGAVDWLAKFVSSGELDVVPIGALPVEQLLRSV